MDILRAIIGAWSPMSYTPLLLLATNVNPAGSATEWSAS
jgi:hypothetical protein